MGVLILEMDHLFELYATIAPMPTDDEMSDWLDDMVFSGDLEGFDT